MRFLGQSFNHHVVIRLFIHKVLHHYAKLIKIRIAYLLVLRLAV